MLKSHTSKVATYIVALQRGLSSYKIISYYSVNMYIQLRRVYIQLCRMYSVHDISEWHRTRGTRVAPGLLNM